MGLFTRRTQEYATPVTKRPDGYGFEMSPGVTVLIQANEPDLEWFAEKLARTIQQVAHEEWT